MNHPHDVTIDGYINSSYVRGKNQNFLISNMIVVQLVDVTYRKETIYSKGMVRQQHLKQL